MGPWIERILLVALAALLVCVAYLMYKRKWEKPFMVALVLAFIAAFSASGWFHGFLKTGVVSILITRMKDLGDELNRYTQTTSDIRNELTQLSGRIRSEQTLLSGQQSNVVESIEQIAAREKQARDTEAYLRSLSQQLEAGRAAISESQAQIAKHQQRLEDISSIVKTVYEQTTTETIDPGVTNSMLIGCKADGSFGVLLRLSRHPIPQTLNARCQSYNVLPTSMMTVGNTVFWKITANADFLRKEKYFVTYVPDPTRKKDECINISVESDGKLKAGGFVLSEHTWLEHKTNAPNQASQAIGAAAPLPER